VDRQAFLDSVVIGFIPGGTGNALVKSVLATTNEDFGVLEAAYLIVRGKSIKMDLTELTLEYEPERRIFSFLSVAWAIVADCDINSEVLRCMGSPRFTVWGIWRCLSVIRYTGTVQFEGDIINNRG
jgi:diacylglycerol kinase family enzyme